MAGICRRPEDSDAGGGWDQESQVSLPVLRVSVHGEFGRTPANHKFVQIPTPSSAIGLENKPGGLRGPCCLSNPPNPPGSATWSPVAATFILRSVFAPFAVGDRLLPVPDLGVLRCLCTHQRRGSRCRTWNCADDGGVGPDGRPSQDGRLLNQSLHCHGGTNTPLGSTPLVICRPEPGTGRSSLPHAEHVNTPTSTSSEPHRQKGSRHDMSAPP